MQAKESVSRHRRTAEVLCLAWVGIVFAVYLLQFRSLFPHIFRLLSS